ncbi:MAG: hypothetical protein ACREK8_06975 [Gemmatimonadales bacterium]
MQLVVRGGNSRRRFLATLLVAVSLAARLGAQGLPERLSDGEFWHLLTAYSEPNGYFRSENLLSNETGFQMVIPELLRTVRPGGVYFGVGPEQNFSYIVAMRPRLAFIVDIRHQNAVQHLLYKALIELSGTRADFLSLLFSRPRPAGLDSATSVDSLFAQYSAVAPDSVLFYRTLAAVKDQLMQRHGFALSADEQQLLEHNLDAFYQAGAALSYNFSGGSGFGRGMPTYADLMVQRDSAGVHRGYLATEANYDALRDIESRNLIVPLTGDFAGPQAIVSAGKYVRDHGAVVTVFYTSNVEQYLFQDGKWGAFARNLGTLPIDSTSTIIRSGRYGGAGGGRGFGYGGGMRSSLLQSLSLLLRAVDSGQVQTYQDVLQRSH